MKGICPNCEKETVLAQVRQKEDIVVRGESIAVDVQFYRCSECGAEFRAPDSMDDPLDAAYREYRRRHGMLQPEEIRQFRDRYGLTQTELANLLGWGAVTISRYENGALQDEAHETSLRLAMNPSSLNALIERKPGALSRRKWQRVLTAVAEQQTRYMPRLRDNDAGNVITTKVDVYSGMQTLNIVKLHSAIMFFCTGDAVPRTKLGKLLFYADFKHFKEYGVGITGSRYAHRSYGPAPENHEMHVAMLLDDAGALDIKERVFEHFSGQFLRTVREPDLNVFSTSELLILAFVKDHFAGLTASAISERSHQEDGYVQTSPGEYISYQFAETLSI